MLRLLVVFHHGGIGLHPPATVWVRLVIHVLGAFLAFVALLVAFLALVVAFVTFASITSFRFILIPSVVAANLLSFLDVLCRNHKHVRIDLSIDLVHVVNAIVCQRWVVHHLHSHGLGRSPSPGLPVQE